MIGTNATLLNGQPINVFSNRKFLVKVFGGLFLALIFTSLVCLVSSKVMLDIFANSDANKIAEVSGKYFTVLLVSLIVLGILYAIISIRKLRMRSVVFPFILYAFITGILLSSLVVVTKNIYFFFSILGITALIFLLITFFALIFNGKMNILLSLLLSSLISAGILGLINVFIFPSIFVTGEDHVLFWVLDFLILFIVLLSTFIDIIRIKKMSKMPTANFASYCSFILFVDFIGVLFRIAKIILRIFFKIKK